MPSGFLFKNSIIYTMAKLKKRYFWLMLGYIASFVFFISIRPEKLSLIFVLLPFFIIFILLYATINLVVNTFFNISHYSVKIISLVLSIMPVLLLVIQSITQLTIRDIILCIIITVIIIWYAIKSQPIIKK